MKFFSRTIAEERAFEKTHILKHKARYLHTDVLEKVAADDGYKAKVDLIDECLSQVEGWILDIGSNTCGECEYLATRGYRIICSDINEYALDISQERARRFNRDTLKYVACDGHRMPFQDNSIEYVTFIESLHHMEDPQATLNEVARILAPGGRVLFYEPYAYNPYRRLSEIRDYFKGTIEKSFSVGQMKRLLKRAGLTPTRVQRHVIAPSEWKMKLLPPHHRFLRKLYHTVSLILPGIFGMVLVVAEKPATTESPLPPDKPFDVILACPITGHPLIHTPEGYLAEAGEQRYLYPMLNDIPVLIPTDAKSINNSSAEATV